MLALRVIIPATKFVSTTTDFCLTYLTNVTKTQISFKFTTKQTFIYLILTKKPKSSKKLATIATGLSNCLSMFSLVL